MNYKTGTQTKRKTDNQTKETKRQHSRTKNREKVCNIEHQ